LKILFALFISVCLVSCEQFLIQPRANASPQDCFESLWNTVNERYSYFELKSVNWDSVKIVYQSKIHADMSERALFKTLYDMLYILRDGHVNLESPFDLARNWNWYLDRPENFNYSILERNYLKDNYEITGPFLNRWFGEVGYIYYSSFSSGFSANELQALMEKFQQAKGIIIDVRNNGGGSLGNAQSIAQCFADQKRPVLEWFYKVGKGRADFGPGQVEYLEPGSGSRYLGKVVILTNRSSYSATTFFTAMMKALPQVQVFGDTTGGGGGLPWLAELPNGWTYRFSSTRCRMWNGPDLEPGIPVDSVITQSQDDLAVGRDPILEAAIEVLE
jgi:hypothetical protein